MKRKMYWSLCVTSIVLVLLTAVLILSSVYGLLLRQAKSGLTDEHRLISLSLNQVEPDTDAYLTLLDEKFAGTRVTLILDNGTVVFDSDTDQTVMQNHRDRPEVVAAFDTGKGEALRKSATMGQDTYYYAAKLDENTVLRVSKQTSSIGAVFLSIIPIMAGVLLLVLLSSMYLASRLTRRLLRPIEGLAENIQNTGTPEGYEELEPFFLKIKEQNRLISEQVQHLREERDTISTITSNMKEGLILLNLHRNILSVNRSALALLGVRSADYEGKNICILSRSAEVSVCIDHAMSGNGADIVLRRDDLACHVFVSPVYHNDAVCGVIILLLDVTEQQKAEKIRRDFSANVSHELKTPLTSISGFAEMMENGMVQNEDDMKKFAGRIYREASRLISLTDDIIRLSHIEEAGAIEKEPLDLRALCQSIAAELQYTAEQKEVTLEVTGEETRLSANFRMMEEVVYNLAENAIKYNRAGGRVSLSVKRERDWVILSVADTGIGIPAEHRERIFERFYRVDKSRSKQTGGTGLGLSIVRHAVERHGGSITLESTQGIGTTITVSLPSSAE